MDKKGKLTLETIIKLVLAILAFFIVFGIFSPLASQEVAIGAKAQVCRSTLAISKTLTVPGAEIRPIKPLCSTDRIKITEKMVKKNTEKGETKKEGAIRLVFEKMKTCEAIVRGPTKEGFFKDNNCYVCYSLEPDQKYKQTITQQEIANSFYKKESPRGMIYYKDLQKGGQEMTLNLQEGELQLGKKEYAIVYLDHSKAAQYGYVNAAVGGCILGGATGIKLAKNPLTALYACLGTAAVGVGREAALSSDYFKDTQKDMIILTELKRVGGKCDQVIS